MVVSFLHFSPCFLFLRKSSRKCKKSREITALPLVLGESSAQGKRWVVAHGQFDKPPGFPPPTQVSDRGGWGHPDDERVVTVGWLAIDPKTGETSFLKPPERVLPQTIAQGTDGVIDLVCDWGKHSGTVAAETPWQPEGKRLMG